LYRAGNLIFLNSVSNIDLPPPWNYLAKLNTLPRMQCVLVKMAAPISDFSVTDSVELEQLSRRISPRGTLFSIKYSIFHLCGGYWAISTAKIGVYRWTTSTKEFKVVGNLHPESHYPDHNTNSSGKLRYKHEQTMHWLFNAGF